jgi:hypothetical protein
MKTRTAVLIAVLAAAVVVSASYASPYWTMRQMRLAAEAGDADALSQYVDFPAVRESLRGELMAQIVQPMLNDPKMKDNPFAGFGVVIMTAMIEPMLNALVSPAGIAAMMKAQKPKLTAITPSAANAAPDANASPAIQTSNGSENDASKVVLSRSYEGVDKFVVRVGTVEKLQMVSMIYRRNGWFSWKLAQISLPELK